ncbi:MFS multidrug transporter-like protein [Astrocystis sublimbata]|nr:MFS multidrug transporter-like protein [Astrocystis sublimbata]
MASQEQQQQQPPHTAHHPGHAQTPNNQTSGLSVETATRFPRPSLGDDEPDTPAFPGSKMRRNQRQQTQKSDAITDWGGPADPDNPKNWSLRSRIYHTMLPALYGFSVSLGTSVFSAGVFAVQKQFHVSLTVSLLGLSFYALGLGFGPIIGAPISETQGRKAVYLITLPLFLLFTAGAGLARNMGSLIHGGGLATVLITSTFFLGPSLGPLIGGYTMQTRRDWRWLMWVLLLIAGPIGLLVLPSRETSKKIILARRAKKRGLPGPPKPPPATALKMLLMITLVRPLRMLVAEPIVVSWSLYHAFVFGVLFAFFESYPYVFGSVYHFGPGAIGLAFLGITIGTVLAVLTFAIIDKTVYQKRKRAYAPARPPPEERLYISMFGAFGVPVALFWFAWTARPGVHYLVPIAAGVPFGWGIVTLFLGGVTFIIDTYGAMFPLFTVQMYKKLGIPWATSLLGFIGLALLPIPFVLYRFGPALRAKSRMMAA